MTPLLYKRLAIFCWIILLITQQVSAQTWEWAIKDPASQITSDKFGNLYTLTNTVLKRYSQNGTLVWSRPLPQGLQIKKIAALNFFGVVFYGTYSTFLWSGQSYTAPNGNGHILGVFDLSSGDLWWKTDPDIDVNDQVTDVEVFSHGQISVAVNHSSSFSILLYDSNGSLLSDYSPLRGGKVSEICSDASGSLLFTGCSFDTLQFQNGDTYTHSGGPSYQYLAKLNSSFQVEWTKSLGVCYYTPKVNLRTDRFSNIYFSQWQRYNGFIVISLNSSGNSRWYKEIEADYSGDCHDLVLDGNGNCWAAGEFSEPYSPRPFFWKLDNSGNVTNTYFGLTANQSFGQSTTGNRLATDGANNVYIAGTFVDTFNYSPTILIGSGPYLAKISDFTTGITKSIDTEDPFIYPNPSYGVFQISNIKAKNISIIDLNGKVLLTQEVFNENLINIDISKFAKGVYILIADDKRKRIVLQ